MNSPFEQMMAEATRLMRSGSLQKATSAIRAALGAGLARGTGATVGRQQADERDVIDVPTRTIVGDVPVAGREAAGLAHRVAGGEAEGASNSASNSASNIASKGPTTRAASEAATGAFTSGSFRNEFGSREYKLFEPVRDERPLPLVVMLHGCKQDPDDFARGTGMNELALAGGFVVLYPAQAALANSSRCWNWFKHNHQARGRGEPGILAGMVRDVIARHRIDPLRVYVAGLSAGGAMAAILGDAYPDLFAAVGVHSGLPTGSAIDVSSAFAAMKGGTKPLRRASTTGAAPPTIVFHGDADTTVHVVNGARVIEAAGLSARPGAQRAQSSNGRDFTRRVLLDGDGAERGEQWTIHCAGHAWSGGQSDGSYTDPRGPDASAEMVRFFFAHPRR